MPPTRTAASSSPGVAIGLLGLGEVGRIYGTALAAAGHRVTGFDPSAQDPLPGVELADAAEAAVVGADVVLTLTAASASRSVAEAVVGALPPSAVYADCTSSSPSDKRALAEVFEERDDVRLADVAILGPVILQGAETPLMAAGPGARAVADVMTTVGSPVEVVDGALGDAMAHKLLRSVFMKGLISVVVEAVGAGREAGMEQWVRGQVAGVLAGDGQAVIDRFLTGTRKHATRRMQEMRATSAYLATLGVPSEMTDAAASALERIAAAGNDGPGQR
jgi:3-hydroxyisobutyrate dehydrogenase-like beta-hydroxyacid dehydrogenase